MSVLRSLAKPYAKALVALAKTAEDRDRWLERLKVLEGVFSDPKTVRVLSRLTPVDALALLKKSAGKDLDDAALSLALQLLVNRRMASMASIRALFEDFVSQSQGIDVVHITSAVALKAADQKSASAAMEKVFAQKLRPVFHVEPLIQGGLMGRVGDLVYDGSIRGSLEKMRESLIQ